MSLAREVDTEIYPDEIEALKQEATGANASIEHILKCLYVGRVLPKR